MGPHRPTFHFDTSGPMRVSDMAACMRVDLSTVSLQLRRLRADHLVERIPDPHDGRVTLLAISGDGRATVARVRAARRDLLQEIFSSTDRAELDQVADLLLRMQQHMLTGSP